MIQVPALTQEKVWLDKSKYDQAEKKHYEKLSKSQQPSKSSNKQQQPLQQQQQSSKKTLQAASSSKADSKSPKETDKGNKSNKTVKEVISQPPAAVPLPHEAATAQPSNKPDDGNETIDGNLTPEFSDLVENKINSAKSNKKVRTYKKDKEKKLPDGTLSSVTPSTNNPPSFQSHDIITPGPTPSSSDPSLITNKDQKKKKTKKERLRNHSKESKVTNVNNSLASEVAKARHHIKTSLQCIDDIADIATTAAVDEISAKVAFLEKENLDLKQKAIYLTDRLAKMEIRLDKLESGGKVTQSTSTGAGKAAPSKPKNDAADDDDGVDLFGSDSDEDDTEAAKIKEQRLAEYAAKKSKKPVLIAKSNIILDVKPWDDETDMKKMEEEVRKIKTDGLIWGASKLVPLAYGIHKLQISSVVEDDKVSVDWLQETIEGIEDYVQSVDIAAFNKV